MSEKKIPVVNHVLDNVDGEEVKFEAQIDLSKVVSLISDTETCDEYEQHVLALQSIVECYPFGFLVKDLVKVFQILNVCADRLPDHNCYTEPICELIQLCGNGFLKEKMSDETAFSQIIIESISQLGYLMRVPNTAVRVAITNALLSLYCSKPPSIGQNYGLRYTGHVFNQKMVEKSDIFETVVKSLSLLGEKMSLKIRIMKFIAKLSVNSDDSAEGLIKSDAAHQICCDMNQTDPSGQLLFLSVEVLWNLLEYGGQKVTLSLSDYDCVKSLGTALKTLMLVAPSNYLQQLRNDLLVITTLVAKNIEAPIIETGLAKQLIIFATFSEVKSHSPLVRNFKLNPSPENFELKKLLINMLETLSRDPSAKALLSDGKVLLSLFHYVKPNIDKQPAQGWTSSQFEELQLHAMSALSRLAVLLIDDYMMCQGNTRLLLLLEWCVSDVEKFLGHGNGFHGAGGRGTKKAQMRYCLRLLRAMVSTEHEPLMQDLCDQGIISQLLGILADFEVSNDSIDLEMQSDMLFILSTLCNNNLHRKELFGSQGVSVLVKYLKMDKKKITGGLGHHKLMLAAVDAVWCCAVGCFSTEDLFLENEGVFLLIDLLESCPHSMCNIILGCLLELCENPKTIAHIHVWRGPGDLTAPHLFISLWRNEEKQMGALRDDNGAVSDVTIPIAGTLQRQMNVLPQSSKNPSQAIVDVLENLRAKIYALFTRMGFSDLPGLTTEDYVTLAIIEKYLDFKLGEVWGEISAELKLEGVRPTSPDEEALATISRATVERARGVSMLQGELMEAETQQDLHDEKQLYVELKENNKQRERSFAHWKDFVKRTSNYNHLQASKKQQDKSIASSKANPRYRDQAQKAGSSFHGTIIKDLCTTTFPGRYVAVKSTVLQMPNIDQEVV